MVQEYLHPDTTIFLGDLFDGGREWATDHNNSSPEKRYKKYGESFWLREYDRFGRIFFDNWGKGGWAVRPGQRGRKILSSLPGNHDLGLGSGIRIPVRRRFNAFFGEGNRVDVIGNHTFVSVDSVSLSAKDQVNPLTGQRTEEEITSLWMPVMDFLNEAQALKRRSVARELKYLNGEVPGIKHQPRLLELGDPELRESPTMDPGYGAPELPTILLTHVPLYRKPGEPCGPFREHWPPTKPPPGQTEPVNPDDRNAISVSQGYQYQNVLTPEISKLLVEKIGNIKHVFSGDDHDYCEVMHRGYTGSGGGIREITVKSMSYAMGVRRPGILMLSLWNPIDSLGNPVGTMSSGHGGTSTSASPTMESHLCLLPDQISIFIRYLKVVVISVLILLVRAVLVSFYGWESFTSMTHFPPGKAESILPLTNQLAFSSAEQEKSQLSRTGGHSNHSSESSTSSTASENSYTLSARNSMARTRSFSPVPFSGGYGLAVPKVRPQTYTPPYVQYATDGMGSNFEPAPTSFVTNEVKEVRWKPPTGFGGLIYELWCTVYRVALAVIALYIWFVWSG
jgi:hypothetical protein